MRRLIYYILPIIIALIQCSQCSLEVEKVTVRAFLKYAEQFSHNWPLEENETVPVYSRNFNRHREFSYITHDPSSLDYCQVTLIETTASKPTTESCSVLLRNPEKSNIVWDKLYVADHASQSSIIRLSYSNEIAVKKRNWHVATKHTKHCDAVQQSLIKFVRRALSSASTPGENGSTPTVDPTQPVTQESLRRHLKSLFAAPTQPVKQESLMKHFKKNAPTPGDSGSVAPTMDPMQPVIQESSRLQLRNILLAPTPVENSSDKPMIDPTQPIIQESLGKYLDIIYDAPTPGDNGAATPTIDTMEPFIQESLMTHFRPFLRAPTPGEKDSSAPITEPIDPVIQDSIRKYLREIFVAPTVEENVSATPIIESAPTPATDDSNEPLINPMPLLAGAGAGVWDNITPSYSPMPELDNVVHMNLPLIGILKPITLDAVNGYIATYSDKVDGPKTNILFVNPAIGEAKKVGSVDDIDPDLLRETIGGKGMRGSVAHSKIGTCLKHNDEIHCYQNDVNGKPIFKSKLKLPEDVDWYGVHNLKGPAILVIAGKCPEGKCKDAILYKLEADDKKSIDVDLRGLDMKCSKPSTLTMDGMYDDEKKLICFNFVCVDKEVQYRRFCIHEEAVE